MKLAVDDGFRDRKVYFSRYELLRILRWTTEGRSYSRLQRALDRLSGVRIKATNAFYDNEAKSHSTRNFGIIDAYEINDGRSSEAKPSFFEWSEAMFKSFQVGFIKKLDLDFYLNLSSAISKRVYRFLDKHFWYRSHLTMDLFIFAHEKVGVSRNYRFASSLRQQLDPALEELKEKKFISDYHYEGKGKGTQLSVLSANAGPRSAASKTVGSRAGDSNTQGEGQGISKIGASLRKERPGSSNQVVVPFKPRNTEAMLSNRGPASQGIEDRAGSVSEIGDTATQRRALIERAFGPSISQPNSELSSEPGSEPSGERHENPREQSVVAQLAALLVERGIKDPQVRKLLQYRTPNECERMIQIVGHYDRLVSTKSRLISRSPVGFLYRAMERPETFVLPHEGTAGEGRERPRGSHRFPGQSSDGGRQTAVSSNSSARSIESDSVERDRLTELRAQYLEVRKCAMQQVRREVEPELLAKILAEVEGGIAKLKKLISPKRFEEALEHGVEERLAKLFAYPEFDEWLQQTLRASSLKR
jgi:hypothetical protein